MLVEVILYIWMVDDETTDNARQIVRRAMSQVPEPKRSFQIVEAEEVPEPKQVK